VGYDVTFHPISLDELQKFVFDILDTPALMAERLKEVSPLPQDRDLLGEMFGRVLRAIDKEGPRHPTMPAARSPMQTLGRRMMTRITTGHLAT
jgi:hypothetical protein